MVVAVVNPERKICVAARGKKKKVLLQKLQETHWHEAHRTPQPLNLEWQ